MLSSAYPFFVHTLSNLVSKKSGKCSAPNMPHFMYPGSQPKKNCLVFLVLAKVMLGPHPKKDDGLWLHVPGVALGGTPRKDKDCGYISHAVLGHGLWLCIPMPYRGHAPRRANGTLQILALILPMTSGTGSTLFSIDRLFQGANVVECTPTHPLLSR